MDSGALIGGAWRAGGGGAFSALDPATGGQVWAGAAADAADAAAAVAAAQAAFPGWAATPLAERIAHARAAAAEMERRGAGLAALISREMGKPLWDARAEVQAMVGKIELSIRAQADRAGERQEATGFGRFALSHRPHGVAVVLGPFNFPGHLPNGHIAPALLAGDTVVFKPSELTPAVGAALAAAWTEAGLPPGVLNLVQGARATAEALLDQPDVAAVLFTGSHAAGAAIHRRFAGRPEVVLALEMGGNAPLLVQPGCAPEAAASLIVHSAFVTSGQRCSCARRLILPRGALGEAVLAALRAAMAGIAVGPATAEPEPFMGPLVHVRAAERALAFEAELVRRGGRRLVPLTADGAFVTPGLIDVTGVDAPDEELFGPLLQLIWTDDLTEAIAVANATRYGLAAGLIGGDDAVWDRVRAEVRAGVLNWNRPTTGASGALPFGGPGWSGSARPSAWYAADYCAYPVAHAIAPSATVLPAPGLAAPRSFGA